LDLGAGMTLEFSGQTARGKGLDDTATAGNDEAWLDDIAPDMVMATLRKRITDKGSAHVRLATFKPDARNGISEVDAPGYTLLDAGASWTISRHLELRAIGRNLLNSSYYASPDPRFVRAPGRNGSVTAVIQF
jgi:outer membrane receptor protein involved in Fe transport